MIIQSNRGISGSHIFVETHWTILKHFYSVLSEKSCPERTDWIRFSLRTDTSNDMYQMTTMVGTRWFLLASIFPSIKIFTVLIWLKHFNLITDYIHSYIQ